jgi:large subunit ribosomal protein L10
MPAQSKFEMYDKVKASLDASKGFYVIDYRGLTVKEAQELRRSLREAGGNMKVYKNNIVKIALEKSDLPTLEETLVGTCAYIFFENDPVSPAKVLKEFAKKTKKTDVLGGIADGVALSADEAKAYAELPSYEDLMAQLVYVIAAPMRGLMTVVNGPARGLALAMKAISEKEAA